MVKASRKEPRAYAKAANRRTSDDPGRAAASAPREHCGTKTNRIWEVRAYRGKFIRQRPGLACTLARLGRHGPDLCEHVVAKNLSAHAAMLLAGPQRAAESFMRLWGREGAKELINALQEEIALS